MDGVLAFDLERVAILNICVNMMLIKHGRSQKLNISNTSNPHRPPENKFASDYRLFGFRVAALSL
jgi:hypothetical protein